MTNRGHKKPEIQGTLLKCSTSSFVLSENYCKTPKFTHIICIQMTLVYNTEDKYQMVPDEKLETGMCSPSNMSMKMESPHSLLLYSGCLCSIFLFHFNFFIYFLFSCPNLFLSSWRTEKGRRRGGGLSPVGKVKLPATELCIKPLLWQLKLSPALCPQCSLLLFLHLPLLFPSHWRGNSFIYVITIFAAVHACCVLVWVGRCSADRDDRNCPVSGQQPPVCKCFG